MHYEVITWRINGKVAGELVELSEEEAESYGSDYLKLEKVEKKEVKKAKNKALSHKDAETKHEQGGTDQ